MIEVLPVITPISPGENIIIEAGSSNSMVVHSQRPAQTSNLNFSNIVQNRARAAQNAVAYQQSVNQVSVVVLGTTVASVQNESPINAVAAQEILTGNTVAETIIDLKAATNNLNPKPGPLPPLPFDPLLYAEVPLYVIYDNPRSEIDFDLLNL